MIGLISTLEKGRVRLHFGVLLPVDVTQIGSTEQGSIHNALSNQKSTERRQEDVTRTNQCSNKQQSLKRTNTKDTGRWPEQAPSHSPARKVLPSECTYRSPPPSVLRRERQLHRTDVASIGDLHVLSVISRNASLHVNQVAFWINHLHLRSHFPSVPTSKFCTVQCLFPMWPGIFFPLNVFPGSFVSGRFRSYLSLTRRSRRAMRHAHAMRGAQSVEAPATHDALEALALRDALDVHALSGNEVAASEFGA